MQTALIWLRRQTSNGLYWTH